MYNSVETITHDYLPDELYMGMKWSNDVSKRNDLYFQAEMITQELKH